MDSLVFARQMPFEEIHPYSLQLRGSITIQNWSTYSIYWGPVTMCPIVETPTAVYSVSSYGKNHISIRDILSAFDYRDYTVRIDSFTNSSLIDADEANILDVPLHNDITFNINIRMAVISIE
jgi:hypothetical protein